MKHSEKQKRKKIAAKIKVGRQFPIDGKVYYRLKLDFAKEQKKALTFDQEITKLKAEKVTIENQKIDFENRLNHSVTDKKAIEKKYNTLTKRSDIRELFSGRWKLEYNDTNKTKSVAGTELFEIRNNGDYYIINNDGSERLAFRLRLIDFDEDAKRLTFVKAQVNPEHQNNHCYNILNIISNDRFEGTENEYVRVVYERQKYESPQKNTEASVS